MVTKNRSETDNARAQECWDSAQRIAASVVFHRAPRIRELLLYLADRSLHGSSEELTESHIADKVFGRKDYNPAEDNLVRASVRQLRLKLKEYFETEGKNEPWAVDLPKGTYQISFARCYLEQLAFVPPAAAERQPVSEPPRPASFRPSPALFAFVVAAAICATTIAVILAVRHPGAPIPDRNPTLMDLLVANPRQQTQVVVIDSAFVLFQNFAGRNIGVEEYAGRTYLSDLGSDGDVLAANSRKLLESRQITSFADVEIASTLSREYGAIYPLRIRHARSMNVREFKSDNNFLLIGSPLANPWTALFDQNLNFRFENHANSWPVIRNRHPRAGEQPLYGSADSYDETGPQYARVAVLHNDSGSGRVALISGTSMEGTEAAGESFLNPGFGSSLAKLFGVDQVKHLPDFEIIIQTKGIGGAGYGATRVLAIRKIAAQ